MSRSPDAESFSSLVRRLELALDASRIGIWEHNATTNEITWDRRLRELYVLDPDEPIRWIELVHPDDRAAAFKDFETAIASKSGYFSQFRILLPAGSVRHLRSRAHYHEDDDGNALMIGAEWDITEDIKLQDELRRRTAELESSRLLAEHAASHDYLTALPNRRAMDRFILDDAAGPMTAQRAALHIDLDHFKTVNDRLGHAAGDDYLRHFALGMQALTPAEAFAGRVGGDEFLVLLPNAALQSVTLLAASIIAHAETLSLRVGIAMASASVGVSIGRVPWRQLVTQSDHALYSAKRSGRGRYVITGDAPDSAMLSAPGLR